MHNAPKAIKAGTCHSKDGETWTHYAVFLVSDIVAAFGHNWAKGWQDDVAAELTGWTSFWKGPGRAFGNGPFYCLYGKKLLVLQRCGLDV